MASYLLDGTYVYFRFNDTDTVMVVMNKNNETVELDLARFEERLGGFRSGTDVITGDSHELDNALSLPPRSVQVLELAH